MQYPLFIVANWCKSVVSNILFQPPFPPTTRAALSSIWLYLLAFLGFALKLISISFNSPTRIICSLMGMKAGVSRAAEAGNPLLNEFVKITKSVAIVFIIAAITSAAL